MKKTTIRMITALSIFLVIGAIDLMLGLRYFLSSEFMTYHSVAVGAPWHEVELGVQTIILALMKVAGSGWFVLGFFTIVMAIAAYRTRSITLRWALPIGTFIFHVGTFVASWGVYQETGAQTPWVQSLVGIGFALLAMIVDAPWSSRMRDTNKPK